MNKLILSVAMITGVSIFAQMDIKQELTNKAQETSSDLGSKAVSGFIDSIFNGEVTWGIRSNGLINTSSLGNLADVKQLKESGYNIGVSTKLAFNEDFFANPELYYTHLGTSRIDLPILFGYNVTKTFAVVAGPSFIYNFSSESKDLGKSVANQAMNTGKVDFAALNSELGFGYQAGLQATISKFVVSAKYDGSLSGQVVDLVNTGTGQKFKEKIKTSLISLGAGFNF